MLHWNQEQYRYFKEKVEEITRPLLDRIEALEATQPPQDEMESYRLALAWIKGQSTDPQAKEIAATALDSFMHPNQETGK